MRFNFHGSLLNLVVISYFFFYSVLKIWLELLIRVHLTNAINILVEVYITRIIGESGNWITVEDFLSTITEESGS